MKNIKNEQKKRKNNFILKKFTENLEYSQRKYDRLVKQAVEEIFIRKAACN